MRSLEFRLVKSGRGAAPGAGPPGPCVFRAAQGEHRMRGNHRKCSGSRALGKLVMECSVQSSNSKSSSAAAPGAKGRKKGELGALPASLR